MNSPDAPGARRLLVTATAALTAIAVLGGVVLLSSVTTDRKSVV